MINTIQQFFSYYLHLYITKQIYFYKSIRPMEIVEVITYIK